MNLNRKLSIKNVQKENEINYFKITKKKRKRLRNISDKRIKEKMNRIKKKELERKLSNYRILKINVKNKLGEKKFFGKYNYQIDEFLKLIIKNVKVYLLNYIIVMKTIFMNNNLIKNIIYEKKLIVQK